MTQAAIYLHTYHFLPPEIVAQYGDPKLVPLDVQERACRAYCERMGYHVFHVYRATTPPPEGVKQHLALRLYPEPATCYHQYGSPHPYYWVRDLLELGIINVVVEFRDRGPSGSMWGDEAAAQAMGRFEWASLWEIEPPTGRQRQAHELMQRIAQAESETEQSALMLQLRALVHEEVGESAVTPEGQAPTTDAPAPPTVQEWLDQFAREQGLSTDEVVQAALEAYAKRHGYPLDSGTDENL